MFIRLTIALVAAAVVATGSGCGGGGDSGASAAQGDTSDKATFLKLANAVCAKEGKDMIKEANGYAKRHSSEKLPEDVSFAKLVKAVVVPTVEAEIAAVRKLGGPPKDKKQIEATLAAQQAAADDVSKLKSLKSFDEVEEHFSKGTKRLKSYGLTECALG